MDRRSEYKNYMLPGIYHITVKAADVLRSPFGKVVGNTDKPDGDPDAPRVALSPVGQMVEQELLHSIAAHYPMVEVQDYVVMPEHMHFIVVVKRKIVNKQGREAHLGQVIAGFKKGCNRRYWELTEQTKDQQGEPAGTGLWERDRQREPAGTGLWERDQQREPAGIGCFAVHPQKKRVPSWGTTGRQPLFALGYCDVMPVDAAQLEQQRAYIKGNPRSRLMRTSNREWLQPQRGGIDTALTVSALCGYLQRECPPSQCSTEALDVIKSHLLVEDGKITCDSYGDRKLLERRLLPVVCHRKDGRMLDRQQARCLEEAEHDTVLVSPRIAKGEQAIMDEVTHRGFPVVLIADNGFPEVYHPSTERIGRCAEGRLLIVTPWKYHYRRKDESITVMECKTMNCLAQALCRRRDDWWK